VHPEPRPELVGLPPTIHGGSDDGRFLDFSTGVSSLTPPAEIVAAIRDADLSRYPHPTALPVREAIAPLHDLSPERVVVGAGAVELIWALARVFAGAGRCGVVVTPTFGEYEQALKVSGARVASIRMPAPAFAFPVEALEAALGASPIAIAFICRPSNPCLTAAPAGELEGLARRWPGTLFVIDEAYLPMFDGVESVALAPNVTLLRSLTKVFALPGLRLGYLLASASVAAAVQTGLPPWNVSSAAQAAGVVAARLLLAEVGSIRARIAALRSSLAERLSRVAGPPERTGGPFLLFRSERANAIANYLRQRRILVRHCSSFGLPDYLRIGVRAEADQEILVRAWRGLPARDR
jgi:histidinol-phosphate/aromatic aminotransferase/cobyric acid decarboxylase-like protein